MIKYPGQVDLKKYLRDAVEVVPKYGLPEAVEYCRTCANSNQMPVSAVEFLHTKESLKSTTKFDENGICDACRFTENKNKSIDWQVREKELRELCDLHRKNDGSFDCLVPGSGGKDSFYAAHILKTKYGMHPLTVTWAPNMYTPWGWKNLQSWVHAGLDNYLMTPNGRVHRLLTRLAVDNLLHPFQGFIIGQKNFAPKMADLFNIKLVFFGENEAEYGNPIADSENPLRDWKYFTSHDQGEIYLGGTSIKELYENFGLEKSDLQSYLPIDPQIVHDKEIEVRYLGYYLKWHPQSCYYYAVEHGGFQASPERTPGTYSKYNSIDDKIDDLHYYTTGVKFGIGRATYDASQETRSRDITVDEAVALIKKYDHEFPERFIDEIFDYLSIPEGQFPVAARQFESPIMDREYFSILCDNFRSPHLWYYDGGWKLRYPIDEAFKASSSVKEIAEA